VSVKIRLKKMERTAQVVSTKSVQDMTDDELLQIIGLRPECSDEELLAIINAEKSTDANR
jgi:hypothetical protein